MDTFTESLTKAAQSLSMITDDLRAALRDASPLEAEVLYAIINDTATSQRRVTVILESRRLS